MCCRMGVSFACSVPAGSEELRNSLGRWVVDGVVGIA